MIQIRRKRFIVVRKKDGYIFSGLAKAFYFKDPADIRDRAVKTYKSEIVAKNSFEMSWHGVDWDDFEIRPVTETIEEIANDRY